MAANDMGDAQYNPVSPQVDLPALEHDVLAFWGDNQTFVKSVEAGAGRPRWTFYEGPPTANGMPGTHHVEARVFKDVFPRFKTMQGFQVERKAGWDCHGLPVELAVEKELGFSGKGDIEAYGVAEFNAKCRESVLRHVDAFEEMSDRMGYWVDTEDPYGTMTPKYVQSVWWALKQIFDTGPPRRGLPGRAVLPALRHRALRPRARPGLRDGDRPVGVRPVPADVGPVRRLRGAARLDDDALDAGLEHRGGRAPRGRLRRRDRRHREPRRRRAAVREGVLGEGWTVEATVSGTDMERWTYQRPFELVGLPRGRRRPTSSCSRTTSRPRTAPASCTSPPPSARTTWRSAAPTGSRWSTRCGPTATSRTRCRWSAASSSSTPTPTW